MPGDFFIDEKAVVLQLRKPLRGFDNHIDRRVNVIKQAINLFCQRTPVRYAGLEHTNIIVTALLVLTFRARAEENDAIRLDFADENVNNVGQAVFMKKNPFGKESFLTFYFTFAPLAISRSGDTTDSVPSSVEAARIMPCDSMPRIFAGSRFATITTFLPIICSGA